MSITEIDPRTALIVVDLQNGIVSTPKAHPVKDVVDNVRMLLDHFRECDLPVVLVNVTGGAPGRNDLGMKMGNLPDEWSELIPDLNQQPTDHLITKRTWGAFTDTDLHGYLQKQGVTQVVIVGISTSIGVESTARNAWELGYNVNIIVDAVTDNNLDAHMNSVSLIFPRMAQTSTTADFIALLKHRS